MTNEKAVAEKLLQINAIKLSPSEPFTWASGWKSPIYCDNRKVLSFPFGRDFIKSEMCNLIFERFPEADLLAGVATAGIGRRARLEHISAVSERSAVGDRHELPPWRF